MFSKTRSNTPVSQMVNRMHKMDLKCQKSFKKSTLDNCDFLNKTATKIIKNKKEKREVKQKISVLKSLFNVSLDKSKFAPNSIPNPNVSRRVSRRFSSNLAASVLKGNSTSPNDNSANSIIKSYASEVANRIKHKENGYINYDEHKKILDEKSQSNLKPPKMPKYEIGKHECLKFFKYYKKLDNLKDLVSVDITDHLLKYEIEQYKYKQIKLELKSENEIARSRFQTPS